MIRIFFKKHKENGFTLIELLLVIAIISVIATLGIATYRRYFMSQRAEKAAIEMQTILEAAMAYNVDHSADVGANDAWPAANIPDSATSRCQTAVTNDDSFVKNYLPHSSQGQGRDTFGGYYCWSAVSSDAQSFAQASASRFWVAIKIPASLYTLAPQIAARLPNGIITSDPSIEDSGAKFCSGDSCFVKSEIVQPGQASSNKVSGNTILATGVCRTDTTSIKNDAEGDCTRDAVSANKFTVSFQQSCPLNEKPVISGWINHYQQAPKSHSYGAVVISSDVLPGPCIVPSGASSASHCSIQSSIFVCMGSGCKNKRELLSYDARSVEGLSYMVICRKNIVNI